MSDTPLPDPPPPECPRGGPNGDVYMREIIKGVEATRAWWCRVCDIMLFGIRP
jgi:hypothetical protein